jgi:hypothetical protein
MSQHCHFDASRSLTALDQDSTIVVVAVIEMSHEVARCRACPRRRTPAP